MHIPWLITERDNHIIGNNAIDIVRPVPTYKTSIKSDGRIARYFHFFKLLDHCIIDV